MKLITDDRCLEFAHPGHPERPERLVAELRKQYEPYLYKDLGWEYYTGAYALFDHPDPAMTADVREQRFYETSLELLRLGRVLKHMFHVPLRGFPYAHVLSLMNQLPVRKGMKVAFEQWKASKRAVREKQSLVGTA